MTRTARTARLAALAAAAAVALTGCYSLDSGGQTNPPSVISTTTPTTPPAATSHPTPSPTATETATGTAAAALALLPVKGRAPKTGYDRDKFPHWSDLDGDGCDTRAEILDRDATAGTTAEDSDGCTVGATIADPYSGRPVVEQPGRGSEVDIDHLVALSDAWQKGAQQLTVDEREQLANDPLNLAAVDDGLNREKSDGDIATWQPPNKSYRCHYVARQIAVKSKYQLWVTAAEHDAIARVLAGCPGESLPAGASS